MSARGSRSHPHTTQIKATFRRAIRDFHQDLEARAPWYSDAWVDQNLDQIADNLDKSMNRWRNLYRSARTLLSRATQPIESGLLTVGSDEYKKHKRHQDQANRQLNLLRNDVGSVGGTERSEFYPYRYFASEGFLPGYNFTRLPLRVFVPGGRLHRRIHFSAAHHRPSRIRPSQSHLLQRLQIPRIAAHRAGRRVFSLGGQN